MTLFFFSSSLSYVKRYAYVMAPMYERDFCRSGRLAHRLQDRKRTDVQYLTLQSNFIFGFSKITITFWAVAIAKRLLEYGTLLFFIKSVNAIKYIFLSRAQSDYRHSVLMHMSYFYTPLLLFVAVSYFVTNLLLEVYETGVEAICLCYVQDKAMNTGSADDPYYMTEGIFKVHTTKRHILNEIVTLQCSIISPQVLEKYIRPSHKAKSKDVIEKLRRQAMRKEAYLTSSTESSITL